MIEKIICPIILLVFCLFFVVFFRKEIKVFLTEINWLKTKWFELKRIRSEIFAKAEEVEKVIEALADNYIYSALEMNRLYDVRNIHKQMISKRKIVEDLLRRARWEECDIRSKTDEINNLIYRDLIFNVEKNVWQILDKREEEKLKKQNKFHIQKLRQIGEIDKEFISLINKANTDEEIIKNLKEYLKKNNISLESFQKQIDEIDYFLKHEDIKLTKK